MMKRIATHYFIGLLSMVLLVANLACKDDKTNPQPVPTGERAENERLLLASTFASGVKDIEYNADKQPEKFFTTGMNVDVSYDENKVTYSYSGEELIGRKVYDIENGLVKSLTEYTYIGGPEAKGFAWAFTYQEGRISKEVITFEGKPFGRTEYSYTNENVTAAKTFDHSGNPLTTTTYEYTDNPDKSGSHNEWHRWVDGTLFPKKAKNLVKKSSTDDHFTGDRSTITYEYVFDEKGYVLSAKATQSNGTVFDWTNIWE